MSAECSGVVRGLLGQARVDGGQLSPSNARDARPAGPSDAGRQGLTVVKGERGRCARCQREEVRWCGRCKSSESIVSAGRDEPTADERLPRR